MAEPVKPSAATTRRAAASRRPRPARRSSRRPSGCSSEQGYAATTMAAIAAEAGVALKTVYVAFETKSGVLRALWHLLLRGDEDDVPVGERDWYREVLDEPDPERAAAAQRAQRRGSSRSAPAALLGVIRSAAPADPDDRARCGTGSRPTSTTTSARSWRRWRERGALRPGSTSTAAPTSCGRSTTPTSGSCSSASAAGRRRSGSDWFADTPAPSCSVSPSAGLPPPGGSP